MKLSLCLAVGLLAAIPVFAAAPQFEIEARFEGFGPSLLKGIDPEASPGNDAVTAPRVTTIAGQRARIEITREVPVPGGTEDGKPVIHSGVILDVSPEFMDGRITLTGRSVVRRRLESGDKQPLDAISFSARETFFGGEVTSGKPLVIQVGDGPEDLSKVTLTVNQVDPASTIRAKHTGLPKYRVYAIEPTPEDAKKPFFKLLALNPAADGTKAARRDDPIAIAGIFQAAEGSNPGKDGALLLVKDALKEIPAEDLPLTIDSTLSPDGTIVDVNLRPAEGPVGAIPTNVSTYWGGDIYLTMADAAQPGGRRALLIRQE